MYDPLNPEQSRTWKFVKNYWPTVIQILFGLIVMFGLVERLFADTITYIVPDTNVTRIVVKKASQTSESPNTFVDTTVDIVPGQTYVVDVGTPSHECAIGRYYDSGVEQDPAPRQCFVAGNLTITWGEPPPPTQCPWDATLVDTDPLCVECQWVPGIIESHPNCVAPPQAPVRRVSWTNPTENDCSDLPPEDPCPPLDDLSGVYIYDSDTRERLWTFVTTTPGAQETVTFPTYSTCFVLTAFDNVANESDDSEIKCYIAGDFTIDIT